MEYTMNKLKLSWIIFILSAFLVKFSLSQSNYASHANNVEYQGDGLPEEATLDGKVTKLDDLSPIIFLNRTKAALNCAAGSMQVDLKFNQPFFGIVYADFDRNSACQLLGKGDLSYRLELPLKGCGTKQEPQRVFTNNIVARFHPGLEMDGDEIITIVCRYPPPVAPIPPGLPAPILTDVVAGSVVEPPLKGFQILLIICAIMFLTLVLLGLAVSYYCLRNRQIPVVRRLPMSLGTGSEITKLSDSSIGNISAFESLKIPRAHALLTTVHSSSISEELLVSDTIPSDYPSETHSEIEEIDTRSLPSAGSYENRAFVQESIYSESYMQTQEFTPQPKLAPKFDVQVRIKRPPPAPPSPITSDTESLITLRHERNLSTIMESHEDRESILTTESIPNDVALSQFTYTPEIHAIPSSQSPGSQYYEKQTEKFSEKRTWTQDYPDSQPVNDSHSYLTTTNERSINETIDSSSYLYPELPIVAKQAQISSHMVDDVFLRTITEKKTIEDIESHKRRVTEYKAKTNIAPKWDVTIRNYPIDDNNQPQWETFSDISSASGMTLTPKMERSTLSLPPPQYINESGEKLTSPELVGNMKPIEMPPEDKTVPNWDVLIRILETPEMPEADDTSSYHSSVHPLIRHLSHEDKTKWKEIITTESNLRTMLTEAVVKEDFEKIRKDARYQRIFEPQVWDVIIRILASPDDDEIDMRIPKRFRKKEAWDTRSRRSSLPTLYEYDSDGGSSVRTIRIDSNTSASGIIPHVRSRRTSRSSYPSDHIDMRSMSEMIVDFRQPVNNDQYDNFSNASSTYRQRYYDNDDYDRRSFQRSISHPSLTRSTSEFTENWRSPDYDISSPEGTPHVQRSQRIMTAVDRDENGQRTAQAEYRETRMSTFKSSNNDHRTDKW